MKQPWQRQMPRDFFSDIGDAVSGALPAINPVGMIGTALGIGSSLINSHAQGQANDRAEQNHWEDVRITREDQNSMHQREVKDLEAAGLNPILSANAGASSGGFGSSPSLTAPQIQQPDVMGAIMASETMKNNATDRALKAAQTQSIYLDNREKQIGGSIGDDLNSLYRSGKKILKDPINNNPFHGLKQKLLQLPKKD